MSTHWTCWPLLCASLALAAEPARLAEPWTTAYRGPDLTGAHVIFCYNFDGAQPLADSAGKQKPGRLRGDSKISPQGKFGGCLEGGPGFPVADVPHGLELDSVPSLTPAGAFTIDFWLALKPEADTYSNTCHLIDKKYVVYGHTDYQLQLTARDGAGTRRLVANLGFGNETVSYPSDSLVYRPGEWHHVAFVYDGAGGGRFFVDGEPRGVREAQGHKGVAPGDKRLVIGDRVGSNYAGFPGYLDQVRLCNGALEFGKTRVVRRSDRGAFVRFEPGAAIRIGVTNLQRQPVMGATLRAQLGGLAEQAVPVARLEPGLEQLVAVPLDTALRPDTYQLGVSLQLPGETARRQDASLPITIVGRPLPQQMPVVMWGLGSPDEIVSELPRLKALGFTHCLGPGCDRAEEIYVSGQPGPTNTPEGLARSRAALDTALANGIHVMAQLSPSYVLRKKPELLRIGRDGKPYKQPDICCLAPRVAQFFTNVGLSMVRDYGDLPAWQGALLDTEIRDEANVCFHDWDQAAFRKVAGYAIPDQVNGRGVDYTKLKGFPANRVVLDDDHLLTYYRWYWQHGDGWNEADSAMADAIHTSGRPDLWTWHDPAARVAKTLGSGGHSDVLSHWTYSYPDPIRIGVCAEELLAFARDAGRPQDVMKMTQAIWYRSQTAPIQKAAAAKPAASPWEDRDPEAAYITIAPMHLREALWTKIARPIKGIMYHGWESLVATEHVGGYRYTHPETQHELARLTRDVIQPLGPTLRQVPGLRSDVALLESFAAEVFAGRGTYGWSGGWIADCYLVAEYAQLQPEIVYDETILKHGLSQYKVLLVPHGEVLQAAVVKAIQAFQQAGGLVVGDPLLCPAIKPQIVLEPVERKNVNDQDKAALLVQAAKLREALRGKYDRFLESSDPEVITYRRQAGAGDYLFCVNDHREYGTYVGQHKRVMENGLPAKTTLAVRRGGAVYDLVAHQAVPTTATRGGLQAALDLEPASGRLLLLVPRPIARLDVQLPATVALGGPAKLTATVVDEAGQPVDAVLPLRLEIVDPDGRAAEPSGHYGAPGGRLAVTWDVAANDLPGLWTVRVTDLAAGRTVTGYVRVGGK